MSNRARLRLGWRGWRAALALLLVWPLLSAPLPAVGNAVAAYDPALDMLLLEHGYSANIIRVGGLRGLRASQRSYATSVWARDLDYAISGYAYPLGDLALFRDNVALFLHATDQHGVVPETIYLDRGYAENRWCWDSMPNIIHAAYVYVAKTGDRAFYREHRAALLRAGGWIARLDSDDDGLPDRDIFPFGYYDSVRGGVLHTYALAKFYAAFRDLAELERAIGQDGAAWDLRALRLRDGFHRPVESGGYWLAGQRWPVAWRRASGQVEPLLETFGVFEALRSGLISPRDGPHYGPLVELLHTRLPELIDGPTPMKLTLGGYRQTDLRLVDPPVPNWMLDASAPWVVGLAAPAYAAAGYPQDAATLLDAYAAMARASDPPVLEFAAGPQARYGPGVSADRGRLWDSAAWFSALYGGHYGLTMTPGALVVQPQPFRALPDDRLAWFSYQGARLTLTLDAAAQRYHISADRPTAVRLLPPGGAALLQLNGGAARPFASLTLLPGRVYTVSEALGALPEARG